MVVFGDSLSDVGNDAFWASLFLGYKTSNGRFTSDPKSSPPNKGTGVWHEELATDLGIAPATRSSSGGSDWAYGGATTGSGTSDGIVVNVGQQLLNYLSKVSNKASGTALYAIWAGGNDLFAPADSAGTGTVGIHDFESAANTAATNLKNYISALAADGAKYFIWPNLPALDQTPRAHANYSSSVDAALADAVQVFNSDVASAIQAIESNRPDVTIYACDVHTWFNELLAGTYPNNSFSNVTLGASSVTPVPKCADAYLFWDQIHPTEKAHRILGDAAYGVIAAPTPLVVAATNWTAAGLTLTFGSDSKLHVYITGTTTDAIPASAPAYVSCVQVTGPASGVGNLTVIPTTGNPIPGGLVETGSGTVKLLGSNTYQDTTTVTSGKLIVTSPAALADGSNLAVGTNAVQGFSAAPIVSLASVTSVASAAPAAMAVGATPLNSTVDRAPPGAAALPPLGPPARKLVFREIWGDVSSLNDERDRKTDAIGALDAILAEYDRQG
jgi:outer membrane lipase/esterase